MADPKEKDLKDANGRELKEKALQEAFKSIEKQYGKGSIMKLGEKVNEQISAMKKALSDNDLKSIQNEAHSIKGGASNINLIKLAGIADMLEKACKKNNGPECSKLLAELENKYSEFHSIASSMKII